MFKYIILRLYIRTEDIIYIYSLCTFCFSREYQVLDYVLFMSCICLVYVLSMPSLCLVSVLSMSCLCLVNLFSMSCLYLSMYCLYPSNILNCSYPLLHPPIIYLIYVLFVSCLCIVYVLSMFCPCLVYVLSMSCLYLANVYDIRGA